MPSAFAPTSFSTYLIAGYGSTKGTFDLQLPGNPPPPTSTFTGNVDYGAVGGLLAYQVRLFDGLAARLSISESLYSGTTGAAVAVVGTNVRLGAGAGLTWSIPVSERLQVAAIADVTYAPRMGLLLGPALREAADSCSTGVANCTFDFEKLFSQKNVFEFRPGVSAAWAPTPSLGVTANLAWAQSSLEQSGATTGTKSASAVDGGLSLDFDLGKVTGVALGLQANVSTRIPVSGDTGSRYTDVGGAFLYTGRKDLSAGLHLVTRRFAVVPNVDVSWKTFLVVTGLTYYW